MPQSPAPTRSLPSTLEFMQIIWALAHALDRTSKHMNDTIGVTGPQRLVLRVVGLMPGLSAGELAAILHVHPSTLTGVLQRLVTQRMLLRTHDTQDRRRAVLHLTARGAQINGTTRGTVEAAVTRALGEVTPHDRAACSRVLERVISYLDRDEGTRPRARRRLAAAT